MQIVIKLKGPLKVMLFIAVCACAVSYISYKAYRYLSYRKTMYDTDQKQKRNLDLKTKVLANDSSLKGCLLLTSIATYHHKNRSNIIIMSTYGHVLIQRQMDGIIYDLRQWHNDGKTLYSYAIKEHDDSFDNKASSSGHIVILDSALNEIRQIHLKPFGAISTNKGQDLDIHDLILLPGDHYIAMAYYRKAVNNIPAFLFPAPDSYVVTPVMQEVRNDSVIWQWDASDHPEFYVTSTSGNKFYDSLQPHDYVHMNSMIIDPRDSNLIVSFLNQNQVLKIDRHTGNIIWRLGGQNSDFPLSSEQVFIKQHNATLTDSNNTLLLLDNGSDSIRPYSRVLEFRLDEQNKVVTSFKSYRIPARIIGSRGSVQKINGNYIICGGISGYILVVDCATGKTRLEIKANQSFYRAYLVDDIKGVKI